QYQAQGVGVSYGQVQANEHNNDFTFAGYVQDRIAFRDDLLVTPGVRFEHATYVRTITNNGGQPGDIAGSPAAHDVPPGVGMIVGKPKAQLFGGFHVGFSPPRVTTAVGMTNGVDQLLDAEKSYEYEFGTRLSPAKWFGLQGTAFMMNFTNQIVQT